jgi:hypothetical protein
MKASKCFAADGLKSRNKPSVGSVDSKKRQSTIIFHISGRGFFILKNKCIHKKGLENAHPALCSSVINILFYHSGHPAIFEYTS